ncbi:hypothetical protein DPEC_G00171360 [Dallia pectoralis]|uniref:Uncharacterized protein n=1 Tax=Dallia pectoralis TaxID=75939 RepID=A0ACC2GD36_DALPE|nr:hypothetical protein DPEC_G00171360 [Dallia pectoralis]
MSLDDLRGTQGQRSEVRKVRSNRTGEVDHSQVRAEPFQGDISAVRLIRETAFLSDRLQEPETQGSPITIAPGDKHPGDLLHSNSRMPDPLFSGHQAACGSHIPHSNAVIAETLASGRRLRRGRSEGSGFTRRPVHSPDTESEVWGVDSNQNTLFMFSLSSNKQSKSHVLLPLLVRVVIARYRDDRDVINDPYFLHLTLRSRGRRPLTTGCSTPNAATNLT